MFPLAVDELPVGVLGESDLQARMVELALEAEATTARFLEALAEWDDQGVWRHQRGAGPKEFLTLEAAMSAPQAAAHVTTARALRQCPETAAALGDGRLSVAKARIIAMFGCRRRVNAVFRACEATLVEGAIPLTLEQTATYLKQWEAALDPDGLPPSDEDEPRAQWRKPPEGGWKLLADLDAEGGGFARSYLDELVKKLWKNTDGEELRPTYRRLLADALVLACQLAAGVADESVLRPPCVTVDMDLATLEGRAGRPPVIDDEPITPEAARRLACDCELHPYIVTALGKIVHWGELLRLANRATRRFLILRDRGCRFPGCTAPPVWCRVHHIEHWGKHHKTVRRQLLLLCDRHHHAVHEGGWTVERLETGDLSFTSPRGIEEVVPERAPPWPGSERPPPDVEDHHPGPARQRAKKRLDDLMAEYAEPPRPEAAN